MLWVDVTIKKRKSVINNWQTKLRNYSHPLTPVLLNCRFMFFRHLNEEKYINIYEKCTFPTSFDELSMYDLYHFQ